MNDIFSAKMMGVLANITQWISGGILASAPSGGVTEEEIMISLPVFIISVISTAAFVWTICRYDLKRASEIAELRKECETMTEEIKLIRKKGCANQLEL